MHKIVDQEIVAVSAARTPVGRFDGILAGRSAIELGAHAIGGAVARAGLKPSDVDTVNLGIVVSGGLGVAPAKAAAAQAGLPQTVHARTVETVCGSGMDALALGVESLLLGTAGIVVAGGMESRSSASYLLRPRFRKDTAHFARGERLRVKRGGAYRFVLAEEVEEQLSGTELVDPTSYDGLFCPEDKKFMRQYALEFAAAQGYTAEEINAHAAESHRKAREATAQGWFREELVPVGEAGEDDLAPEEWLQQQREADPADLASAYNASTPADGAAALVLTTGERARALGLQPLARVLGYARYDCPAAEFLSAPVKAANELVEGLRATGRPADFGIIEANEAFGIQLPLFAAAWPGAKLNVHGGAIALGHPLGAAGARISTTLLYAMQRYGERRGIATICYGGGGGYAMAFELVA